MGHICIVSIGVCINWHFRFNYLNHIPKREEKNNGITHIIHRRRRRRRRHYHGR